MTIQSQNEPRETDLDHTTEDELDRMLIGFANDLLAYEDRMDKAGSSILFIHSYVTSRKKKFRALIQAELTAFAETLLEKQRLIIEHGAYLEDMEQYFAVPVKAIQQALKEHTK